MIPDLKDILLQQPMKIAVDVPVMRGMVYVTPIQGDFEGNELKELLRISREKPKSAIQRRIDIHTTKVEINDVLRESSEALSTK